MNVNVVTSFRANIELDESEHFDLTEPKYRESSRARTIRVSRIYFDLNLRKGEVTSTVSIHGNRVLKDGSLSHSQGFTTGLANLPDAVRQMLTDLTDGWLALNGHSSKR